MKIIVQPWKMKSKSAQKLTDALARLGLDVSMQEPGFVPAADTVVVNWGCGYHIVNNPNKCLILNHHTVINKVINKYDFFQQLHIYPWIKAVPSTFNYNTAVEWARNGTVFCRKTLEGRDGNGIVLARGPQEVINCHLYTKKVESTEEWRIHVFRDTVLAELLKVPEDKYDPEIRTGGRGWYYEREHECPPKVRALAAQASRSFGIDFGGVDILWNNNTKEAHLLEINSAPELGPYTAPRLAAAIRGFVI